MQAAVEAVPVRVTNTAPDAGAAQSGPPAGSGRPASGREGLAAEFARLLREAASLASDSEEASGAQAAFAPLPLEQIQTAPEDDGQSDGGDASDASEAAPLPDLSAASDAQPSDAQAQAAAAVASAAPVATDLRASLLASEAAVPATRGAAGTAQPADSAREPSAPAPAALPENDQAPAPVAPRAPRASVSSTEQARDASAERAQTSAAESQAAAADARAAADLDARNDRSSSDRNRDANALRALQPVEAPADAGAARPAVAPEAAARSNAPAAGDVRVLPEIPAHNEHELLRRVQLLADGNGGQARIQLQPPQLGSLDMKLTVTERFVQLDLVADRMPVAELFGRHLPELQQALEAHGLRIDRANIEFRDRDPGDPQSFADRGRGEGNGDGRGESERREDAAYQQDRMRRMALYGSLGAVDVRV